MTLSERIKNADRILKANNLIVQAVEKESNREIMTQMLEVSQSISDVHKACVADLKFVEKEPVKLSKEINS